jgi:hypothetical protein
VDLDGACRRQQVGEGCFGDLSAVPRQAISMAFAKSLNQKRSLLLYPTPAKHQQSRLAKDLSAPWLQHERMRGRPSTGNPRRCLVPGHFPRSLPPDGHSLKSKSHRNKLPRRPHHSVAALVDRHAPVCFDGHQLHRSPNALAADSLSQRDYHWANSDYVNLVIAFRVAYAIGQTLNGRLMDRIGTQRGLTLTVL